MTVRATALVLNAIPEQTVALTHEVEKLKVKHQQHEMTKAELSSFEQVIMP